MKLRTHHDTGAGPECDLYFHFFHKLFTNPKDSHLNNLDWKFDKNTQQRLYLNKKEKGHGIEGVATRMLEIITKRLGILYTRNETIAEDKLVSWEFEAKIPNFPYLALTVTSHPTMLSPDFEHMFDFNYKDK